MLRDKGSIDMYREEKFLCRRWRVERNFWISFFSLVLWIIMQRVYELVKHLEKSKATSNKKKE